MKKELVYLFDCYRNLKNIESMPVVQPEVEKVEVPASATDALIKVIYALDPVSKLPTGDLGYYVSDKANPEIKEFILKNLYFDTSSAANVSVPDGIDSSLALDLMRNKNETPEQYQERLNNFAIENVEFAKSIYSQLNSKKEFDDTEKKSDANT